MTYTHRLERGSNRSLLKLFISCIILWMYAPLVQAQNCRFFENSPIVLNAIGYNTTPAFYQQYALTDKNGIILQINAKSPVFPHQSAGLYFVHAINYRFNEAMTNFAVGNNIAAVSGTCFDRSTLSLTVCQALTDCQSSDGTISITHVGLSNESKFKQFYLLANENGVMEQIKTAPTSTDPLFTGVAPGNYLVYALEYDIIKEITNLNVGKAIADISGDCFDLSNSLPYKVCVNEVNCNAPNGRISLNNEGYNQRLNFRQTYILTDNKGTILTYKNQPATTQYLFTNLEKGDYQVYAINYVYNAPPENLTTGQPIHLVTSECMDRTGPLFFNVCEEICGNGIDDDNNGFIDCADANCSEPCPCGIAVTLEQAIYNDNGTGENITDDTFTFQATINGEGNIGWEGGGKSGIYGTSVTYGPYPIDASGASFRITDKVNKSCFTSISVNMSSCVYLETCTCCAN